MEPAIARRYELETRRVVWNPETIVRHPEFDVLMGTPDRLVVGEDRGVEIKTSSIHRAHEWGDSGTDHVPMEYVVQCCHYMMVTGLPVWDIAVLIGGSDFRMFTLRRNPDVEKWMIGELLRWWDMHVVRGERPPIGGTQATRDWIRKRWPKEAGEVARAGEQDERASLDLVDARQSIENWEAVKTAAENRLKVAIGEAPGMVGDGWRVSWKLTKGRQVRDLAGFTERMIAMVAAMLTGDEAGNRVVAAEMVNAELDKATVEQPGSRRFLFTQSKGVRG